MDNDLYLIELADRLAQIAAETRDAKTAAHLMALANRILATAAVPVQPRPANVFT